MKYSEHQEKMCIDKKWYLNGKQLTEKEFLERTQYSERVVHEYSEHQEEMWELESDISYIKDELYALCKNYVLDNKESILNQWWEFFPVDDQKPTRSFYRPTSIDQIDEHHEPEILGTFIEVNSHSIRVHQNVLHGFVLDGFLLGPSSRWEPVEVEVVQKSVDDFSEAHCLVTPSGA